MRGGVALVFTKFTRRVVWRGNGESCHDRIECAVRADRSSPGAAFWDRLSRGDWADDPYFAKPPDGDQIHNAAKILAKIEYVGKHGVPENKSDINSLREGIWEFRHHHHRLAYFDTPGDGTFTPKRRVRERSTVDPNCSDEFWWYPHMDEVLRLTNGWAKEGQMAPPEAIELAIDIREEDVQHDRSGKDSN